MTVREHIQWKLKGLVKAGLTLFKTSDIQELAYIGKHDFGKFLGSSETLGFQDLISHLDFPEMIMPHHIFDYFVNHQGSYIFDHLTHRRWIEVLNAIDRAGDQDEETVKILKTIGLLNIIGSIAPKP